MNKYTYKELHNMRKEVNNYAEKNIRITKFCKYCGEEYISWWRRGGTSGGHLICPCLQQKR